MKRAVKFLLQHGAAGLFLDPGLGKTSIVLAALKILKAEGIVGKTLVVAPLRVAHLVWPAEARKWTDFHGLKVVVAHGPKKAEALRDPEADVVVLNVDGLAWLTTQPGWKFDALVVDESTMFKNPGTQRFKIMRKLLPMFRRRFILTGTPVPNGYLNLFGQVYILDGGRALGRYVTHYRNQYFYPTGYGGYEWKLRDGADEEINEAIKPLVMRLASEDYLELPPLVASTIEVELPPAARKAYDELKDDFITELKSTTVITAVNAAAMTTKLRQVACGGIYGPDGVAVKLHDEKTEVVRGLVAELNGSPAIVVYDTHHDLERLRRVFPEEFAGAVVARHIGGDVSARDAADTIRMWNAGDLPVLLAQPQSVSHGLNLQAGGRHVIWHSLTWDLENYEQLNRRVWRQGQMARVFVYHVVARNTIDEQMMMRLRDKASVQDALLAALK